MDRIDRVVSVARETAADLSATRPAGSGMTPAAAPVAPFQLGYVTTDLSRAREVLAADLGVRDFLVRAPMEVHASTPSGPIVKRVLVAFAFLGETQIELIQPLSGNVGVYTDVLPPSGFGLALHHLGFLVDGGLEDWAACRRGLEDRESPVLFEAGFACHTRFIVLDTRARLGHHLEYVWWSRERRAWLNDVPRSEPMSGRYPDVEEDA